MSDFLYTKLRVFGREVEIMTPKHRPDAQWEHTLAFYAAYNELRQREADALQKINSYAADMLRKPVKVGSRENPARLTRGSKYLHNEKLWRPALPLDRWHAPKPNSDRQARLAALKISGKDYAPDSVGWKNDGVTRVMFRLDSYKEG
jgi:hypothetical protein